MPTRSYIAPHRRALVAAVGVALSCTLPPAMAHQHSHKQQGAASTTCPLGSFTCPPRPVSFALCRRNDLLDFYQSGLPEDTQGRERADTLIDAEHARTTGSRVYDLTGQVRLQRYDQLLRARHATYNADTTAYDARGDVRYQDASLLMSASRVRGTTQPDHAVAENVRYQMLKTHGNGKAKQATIVDKQHDAFAHATYSTCDPSDRVWEFRGKSIQLNKATGVGTAHSATMRYRGVPFLYLPYFTFPIDNRRKSGFLYPTIGNSGNTGFSFRLPYYLNLAPNYDATITPTLYTDRGVMLGGQFRYLTHSSQGVLNVDYLPNDSGAGTNSNNSKRPDLSNGADRYYIQFDHSTRLSPHWGFYANIRNASDRYFFRDFSNGMVRAWTSVLASSAYLRGGGEWWDASFGVDRYQSVDPGLSNAGLQYKRWPRATFDMDTSVLDGVYLDMQTEAVAFRKENAVQGDRVDIYPTLTMPFDGAAWFVHPSLGYRYTAYQLESGYQNYGFSQRTPSRALPIASLDSGLIFERDTRLFGTDYTQTLEPRLYYLYVPYRNQQDLPIFDTREMTFDYWQLFSSNRFSGADRQMDADNLTAAVTSRLLDADGAERASVSFGQIHYFRPQRVQLYGQATNYTDSAYVTELDLRLSDNWRMTSSYQWDPHTDRTDVGTLGVQRRVGTDGVFNFTYRFRRNLLEQFDVSAVYPVSPSWRLLGRWNVALRDRSHSFQRGHPKTLEAVAGVEYDSCCIAVRLVGHHYVRNVQGDTNNAVMLEIQFKGLGTFTPQTETFLRHAILGYQ